MRTIRSGWLANVVAVLASTTFSVVVAEIVIRALGRAPDVKPIVVTREDSPYQRSANPVLAFELKANHVDPDADGFESYARTNSHGQRDLERSIEKRPGSTRVVVLGDSVVEGYGLRSLEDTMTRQLERMLGGRDIEVLNFGTSGYCTLPEVELLDTKGLRFDPDVVALVFVENDFENLNREFLQVPSEFERPRLVEELFLRSDLFRLVSIRFDLFDFGAQTDPMHWNKRAIGNNNVMEGLRRLRAMADARNFVPIVAIWPRFTDDRIEDVHFMPDGESLVIERLARMYGIESFRLSDLMERDLESLDSPVNPRMRYTIGGDEMHPNKEGNRIAAIALEAILTKVLDTNPSIGRSREMEEDPQAIEAAFALGNRRIEYELMFNNLGVELARRGNHAEAIEEFRKGLELNPLDIEVRRHLALALRSVGNQAMAAEHLEKVLEIEPRYLVARMDYAELLGEQGDTAGLKEHYRMALEMDARAVRAHLGLGKALSQDRQYDRAIEHFERALALAPDLSEVHYNIGVLRMKKGQPDLAEEHFEEALRIVPEFHQAQRGLERARSLRSKGR